MDRARTECLVCNENYDDKENEPHCLTCGHTICLTCLNRFKKLYANKPGITCPFCRKENLQAAKNFALIDEFKALFTSSGLKKANELLDKLAKTASLPNGLYRAKAKHSGKYLGIRGGSKLKGVGLVQNDKGQQLHEVFKFLKSGDFYQIIPQHSLLTLQIPSDYFDFPLAPIIQGDWNGEDHQLWKLEKQGDGAYFIVSKKSNMCFDVDCFQQENDTAIVQFCQKEGDDASNQLFYLEPVV